MELIKTFTKNHLRINMGYDELPENPREWDNLTKIVAFHKRYSLGDEWINDKYDINNYSGWDELEAALHKDYDIVFIKPIFLYDHGELSLSYTKTCKWDSGQIGFIFVDRTAIDKIGIPPDSIPTVAKAELQCYEDYLNGYVYAYEIIDTLDNELVDTSNGYYGTNHYKYMLRDIVSFCKRQSVPAQYRQASLF